MFTDLPLAVWFLLPIALANVAPIIGNKVPYFNRWKTPIDFGRQYRHKAFFGPNKTWRGIVIGMIAAVMMLWVEQRLTAHFAWSRHIAHRLPYSGTAIWLLGPLLAIGALGGDAVESFFKRQRNIPAGDSWFPFDQLDYVIGAIIITVCFFRLSLGVYAWTVVLGFLASLVSSYIGWRIGLKDKPI